MTSGFEIHGSAVKLETETETKCYIENAPELDKITPFDEEERSTVDCTTKQHKTKMN